jgi:hypothetical protein
MLFVSHDPCEQSERFQTTRVNESKRLRDDGEAREKNEVTERERVDNIPMQE